MAGLVVLRVAPDYTYSLETGADQITKFPDKGVTVREISRSPANLGGKPSLRLDCEHTGDDGFRLRCRYHLVNQGRLTFVCFAGASDPNFLTSETLRQFFGSVKFPAK